MIVQSTVLPLWNRQAQLQRKLMNDKDTVYQVASLEHPKEILAMTSKESAQRLIAQLADRGRAHLYKITTFQNPSLPGLEHTR
jgi:hypothetical protein